MLFFRFILFRILVAFINSSHKIDYFRMFFEPFLVFSDPDVFFCPISIVPVLYIVPTVLLAIVNAIFTFKSKRFETLKTDISIF